MIIFKKLFLREILVNVNAFNVFFSKSIFFVIIISLFSITIKSDKNLLLNIGNILLWISLMVSVIQNFDQIFTDDYENGWLEQIFLNENTKYIYIFSKCLCLYIINLIPLLIVCPIAFILLDIPIKILPFFYLTLFIVLGSLILLGALSSSLTIGSKLSSIISIILILPLTLPIIIFAILSTDKESYFINYFSNLLFLSGIFLIFLVICPIAIVEGLKILIEEE